MAIGTQVVYWSGAKRWEPNKIDGYLVTIRNGKIVSAEPIDTLPPRIPAIQVQKQVLNQLPLRQGVWADQWEVQEEEEHVTAG